MVKSVEINNFRAFEELRVVDLARINMIVGDNGIGKTAFLEAIYLALSSHSQGALVIKQWRGMGASFQTGSVDSVVEGVYADLFRDSELKEPIRISLTGNGFENRQLIISKTKGDIIIPPVHQNRRARRSANKNPSVVQTVNLAQSIPVPISLMWIDDHGARHQANVSLSPAGLHFEGTGETLPNCYMFAANAPTAPNEAAEMYAAIRKRRDHESFRKVFFEAFDGIIDIQVDATGGQSVLIVDVEWAKKMLPLPVFSGGTTRAASILLALGTRRECVVLVDEVENGIYHRRQQKFASAMLSMSKAFSSQIIMTTHSQEWIDNFLSVAKSEDDIAFWRLERINNKPVIKRFSKEQFSSGMSIGEMR